MKVETKIKNKIYYKTVLLPIEVAFGDYCFGGREHRICPHFNNEGGHPNCYLFAYEDLKYDNKTRYVKKPDSCKNLKEV